MKNNKFNITDKELDNLLDIYFEDYSNKKDILLSSIPYGKYHKSKFWSIKIFFEFILIMIGLVLSFNSFISFIIKEEVYKVLTFNINKELGMLITKHLVTIKDVIYNLSMTFLNINQIGFLLTLTAFTIIFNALLIKFFLNSRFRLINNNLFFNL